MSLKDFERAVTPKPKKVSHLWEAGLTRKDGKVAKTLRNVAIVLEHAPELVGAIAFDDFAMRLVSTRATPAGPAGPWTDDHDLQITVWLQGSQWAIEAGDDLVSRAVRAVASRHRVHPLRDRLAVLKWDGVPRVDRWTTTYLGAEDTEVHRAIASTWLLGAIARAFEPGCKVDAALILEGSQGAGKSTALRVLSLGYFSDELADIGGKDAAMQLQGAWIHELAELDAVNRAEATRVKSFLTRSVDRFRPPWGRHVVEVPRQCVFAGSTNHDAWLRDETGGRRFLPVRVGAIDLDALRRDVEQLWAEAVARFRAGEKPFIADAGVLSQLRDHASQRFQVDVWHAAIEQFAQVRESVSVAECLTHLGIEIGRWSQADQNRVSKTLVSLGYRRVKTNRNGVRQWRYMREAVGPQGPDWDPSQSEKTDAIPTGPSSPTTNTNRTDRGRGPQGLNTRTRSEVDPLGPSDQTDRIDAPSWWEVDS